MRLNLVFHDIVKNDKEVHSFFCITKKYYFQLINNLLSLIQQNKTKFKEVCFYFDDGYQSFKEIVFPEIKNNYKNYALAIVIEWIGKKNFLNERDILNFKTKGVKICSHGVSHAALAIYKNDKLQDTLRGGDYQNNIKGKKNVLKQNEVLYQFKESKKMLEKIKMH